MLTRKTAAAGAFLVGVFAVQTARANPGITGYAGKPYGGTAQTCVTTCHGNDGAKPTLAIDVPSAVTANATAQVSITVNGSNTRTSLNAALSDGVTATAGQNTAVPFPQQTPGEVAAVSPPPNGGSATYKFSFVAPNKNGPITLWIAGMAANGTGTGGDGVTFATRTITVSGATPGTTPNKDGGTSSSGDGGSSSNGDDPSNPGSGGDDDDDNGDDDDGTSSGGKGSTGTGRRQDTPSGSSCATAPGDTASVIAPAAMAAFIVAFSQRRRRRS